MTGTPATGEEPTEAPEPTEQQAGASSGTGGAVIQPSATGSTLIINKNNCVIKHFKVLRKKKVIGPFLRRKLQLISY